MNSFTNNIYESIDFEGAGYVKADKTKYIT